MKKFISILLLGAIFSIKTFGAITISPTNLAGVNDTAYCQYVYTKVFTASGGVSPYHYTVSVGSLPTGLSLDSLTGRLSGTVSYTSNTSVAFTIKARQTTGSASGTRAYTMYIRNKVLTAPQLTNIWSQSVLPVRSDVYATWFTTYTNANSSLSGSYWKLGGNTLGSVKTIGANDSVGFAIETNATNRMVFNAVGKVGVGKTPVLDFDVLGRINSDSSYYLYGYKALYYPAGATTNYASGFESGNPNVQGNGNNTSLGFRSLKTLTTGGQNTAIGSNSSKNLSVGSYNTSIGYQSLRDNDSDANTAIGFNSNVTGTGSNNTSIGYQSMRDCGTGYFNTAIGANSLRSVTTGNLNTFIGESSGVNMTIGFENVGIGAGSLIATTSGVYNTAVGNGTGYTVTTGTNNTFVGYQCAKTGSLTTGSNNTLIGSAIVPATNISGNVIISDGLGAVKFQTTATNELHIVSDSITTSIATASTNKIKMVVNGVTYYVLVTTTP